LSISQAVRSTSNRNCSIWIQLSAIFSWVIWKFDSGHPGLAGDRSLTHHVECSPGQRDGAHGVMNAPAAQPVCAIAKAWPSPPRMWSAGTGRRCSDVAVSSVRFRADAHVADDLDPGVPAGTMNNDNFVAGAGVGIGDRHDDEKRGVSGVVETISRR